MGVTEEIARFVVDFSLEKLPAEVSDQVRLGVMDTLASAFACFQANEPLGAMILANYMRELGGKKEATLVGFGDQVPCSNAVFINTALAMGFHFDSIHDTTSTHALAMIVPTALAVAELKKVKGNKVMEAIVVGLDILVRSALSVGGAKGIYSRGIHPSSLCGSMGCAASAAKILELSLSETIQALGLAATRGFGLIMFDDNQSSFFEMAKAAQSGLDSAFLVERGFAGPSGIFEDETRGFCRVFSNSPNFSALTERLGEKYAVAENTLKPYAVERFYLSVIEASMQLNAEYQVFPEEIDEMTIRLGIPIYASSIPPTDIYQSQRSGPYLAACSLILGKEMKFSVLPFLQETRNNQKIMKLMKRIRIFAVPKLANSQQEDKSTFPCILEVKTKDGRKVVLDRFEPEEGSPKNRMSENQIKTKFEKLAVPIIGVSKVKKAIELLSKLEKLNNVGILFDQLH